jgi:excisionase family DNA binding protein
MKPLNTFDGQPDVLLTLQQAAEFLATTPRHVRELRLRRELPVIHVGSRLIRFDLNDLNAYRKVQREPARRGPLAGTGLSARDAE